MILLCSNTNIKSKAATCAADTLGIACKVRFPGATPQLGGIPHCLLGRIWNQAVCFLGPVVFPAKTFPPWEQAEHAAGAATETAQGGYGASSILDTHSC